MTEFTLDRPAFEDGGAIPRRYGYRDENLNPPPVVDGRARRGTAPLRWRDAPPPSASSR